MCRRFALVGLLAVYWAVVLTGAFANSPQEFGDTYRYLDYSILDIQNPGIIASAVLQAAGTHSAGVWTQVVLSALAWSLLAVAVIERLGRRGVSWALATIVLVLSLSTPVWSWNTLLASESTAITCAALWLASAVWLSGAPTRPRVWMFMLASTLLIVARPQLLLLVVTSAAVAVVWFARATRRFATAVLAIAPVALGTAWGVFRLLSLSGEPKYRLYFAMNNIVDKGSFRDYAFGRMPRCEPLESLLAGPQPWSDMFAFRAGPLIGSCPESYIWLKGPEASTLKWLMSSPIEVAAAFTSVIPSLTMPVYSDGRALPGGLGTVLASGPALWILAIVCAVLGLAASLGAGFRWRPRPMTVLAVLAVLASGFVTGVLIWSADGIELDRHLQPVSIILLVGLLILPSVLLAPRQLAVSGPSAEEPSPTL